MMRLRMALWVVVMLVAALAVYEVKYEVRSIKQEVARLEGNINKERESIHILQAEWTFLTRPERLKQLAEKHLQLAPVAPTQIREEASLELPEKTAPDPALAAAQGGSHE